MKHITIICKGNNTAQVFKEQLHALLGSLANISHYASDFYVPESVKGDVVLISSSHVLAQVRPFIADMRQVVVARRSVNYHEINKLFAISPGTDVLLVNDMEWSARETLGMLQMLGIDHINYHPYYPGCVDCLPLDIAVTPGEMHLVPEGVRRIVDIKTRVLDITTIIDVLSRLGLLERYADMISAHYVRDIIALTRDNTQIMQRGSRLQSQLQAIINTVHDGIVSTDEERRISVFNPVAEEIFSLSDNAVLGRKIEAHEALNVLLEEKNLGESEWLRTIGDRHVILNVAEIGHPTERTGGGSGKVYTLKDVSEIRRLEESARRKLKDEHKLARYTFADVTGESPAIRACLDLARKMAVSEATILLEGESGTGKEVLAQSIHNASARKSGPFIAVNFAAMTETLLESELFGYEPGAFTGATRSGSIGLFEAAHKGTIFLDEIGDAPLPFQVKLLRVLQERQIKRVGSSKVIPIDVRVIAATNTNLKQLTREGQFRNDLYYRLNVLPLALPPLKERKEDIALLAKNHYRRLIGREPEDFFAAVLPFMEAYSWPGNIRELHNLVEYLVNIYPSSQPPLKALPAEMRKEVRHQGSDADAVHAVLSQAGGLGKTFGRRSLARLTGLSESRIRAALAALASEKKIVVHKGRKGVVLGTPLLTGKRFCKGCSFCRWLLA